MDINEVTICGSIKEISNIKTMKNGQHCCWLRIITNVSYNKKDGTIGNHQVQHRVVTYGKYASVIKEEGSINQKIFLQGRLRTKNWDYNNNIIEEVFIVLERFKLHPLIHRDESKEEQKVFVKRQEILIDDYFEERSEEKFENESELLLQEAIEQEETDWEEINDNVDSYERQLQTGWPDED